MKIRALLPALLIIGTLLTGQQALSYDKENEKNLHDHIVDVFKDIEAIFSWHVEDRKTLKEDIEEAWQGILS